MDKNDVINEVTQRTDLYGRTKLLPPYDETSTLPIIEEAFELNLEPVYPHAKVFHKDDAK